MNRAQHLLGLEVTPTDSAKRIVYASVMGDIVQNFCLRNNHISTDSYIIESDTFRVPTDTGLSIFHIPNLDEFIQTTKMQCIRILENGMIVISMNMKFREAMQKTLYEYRDEKKYIFKPERFIASSKYTTVTHNRIKKYFT